MVEYLKCICMNRKTKSTLNYIGAGALAAGAIAAAPMTGGASLYAMPLASTWAQNTANRQAIDEQNEYNSPSSQMARYRDAGLNPNLIYSQGNPGNQSSPVSLGVPELDPMGPRGTKRDWENVRWMRWMNESNAEAAWQRANLIEEQRHLTGTKQIGELTRNTLLEADLPYARGNALERYRGNKAKAEILLSEVNLKSAQLANFQMDNRIKSEVLRDKMYTNWMKQFGIERSDNIFLRGGARVWHQFQPALRKAWMDNQKSKR